MLEYITVHDGKTLFQTPDKISHSAAHLLLSVVSTVRPSFLLHIPCVQKLYNSASHGAFRKINIEVSQFTSSVSGSMLEVK